MVGIEGQPDPLDDETPPRPWARLEYAPEYTQRIRRALNAFGYRALTHPQDPTKTAGALEQAVDTVLGSGPGFVVVHLLTHGDLGQSGALYPIGGDYVRTRVDVEQWLKFIEDAQPPESAPYVLFLLDLCYAGANARNPWHNEIRTDSRRAWVISANEVGEEAWQGWLSLAIAEVLESVLDKRIRLDPSTPYFSLSEFCRHIAERVELYQSEAPELKRMQRPLCPTPEMGSALNHLAFLPNPRYVQDAPESSRARIDPAAAPLLDEVADEEHFFGRASGTELILDQGDTGLFRGRKQEASHLSTWLNGKGGDLCLLTGKPGAGKSALLGTLVCAAHPALRREKSLLWQSLAEPPSEIAELAVVHARQRSVTEVMAALGRQWKLGQVRTAEEVVTALDGSVSRPVLVLDALDEAEHPRELMDALLTLKPVCRMLIGVRSERLRFAPLFRRARQVNLNKVSRSQLRSDLRDYVHAVLAFSSRYSPAGLEEVRAKLADNIARTLVRHRIRGYGEFLVAALYLRSVVNQPDPPEVPRTLDKLLDLTLYSAGRKSTPWLKEVLAALAHAHGSGMPEGVVQAAASAFATGERPDIEHIRAALDEARFHIRRDVDAEGRTVYRLFHQGLADHLRSQPDGVLTRLLALTGTPHRWHTADPYLLRHVDQHAAEASRLKELLNDPQFLVHADPDTLEPLLHPSPRSAARGLPVAELYGEHFAILRQRSPAQRQQTLAIAAVSAGWDDLAKALLDQGPWNARRVGDAGTHVARSGVISHDGVPEFARLDANIYALQSMEISGYAHVLAGIDGGVVHTWGLSQRTRFGKDPDSYWCRPVTGVDLAILDGRPLGFSVRMAYAESRSTLSTWELPSVEPVRHDTIDGRLLLFDLICTTVEGRPIAVLCGRKAHRLGRDTGVLLLWDLVEHRTLGTPLTCGSGWPSCVATAKFGDRPFAVTGGSDGAVRLWDLEAWAPFGTGTERPPRRCLMHHHRHSRRPTLRSHRG
nr:AAA family ATPase [Streptomyces sp. RPA4-2]